MLQTTRAVVLRTTKHTDKSTVLRVYTERFGLRAYLARTGSRSGASMAALQPLSRVEMVVPEDGDHGLRTVKEIRIDRAYTRIHLDPLRGVLLLFTQEVLERTLRGETADAQLYGFVEEVLEAVDVSEDLVHQPLRMLVGLSGHLGFAPEGPVQGEDRFDLREGCFFRGSPPHELCMDPDQARLFALVLERGLDGPALHSLAVPRRRLLDDLLIYFRLHVDGFGELRSLEVLRSVLA